MPDEPRPHVIVHMASSVDGRIQAKRWSAADLGSAYEDVHTALAGDAWMVGRITMQGYTRGTPEDDTDATAVVRIDHIARRDATAYAIGLDPKGRLHWGHRDEIEGDHVVMVVGDGVSDQHLNALQASGVSYILGGPDPIDLPAVLRKLRTHFGIERLLVEGGGHINGTLLAAGLVNELSLLVAPAVDGGRGIPAVFDLPEGASPAQHATLTLASCTPLANGVVHLRYDVANG